MSSSQQSIGENDNNIVSNNTGQQWEVGGWFKGWWFGGGGTFGLMHIVKHMVVLWQSIHIFLELNHNVNSNRIPEK